MNETNSKKEIATKLTELGIEFDSAASKAELLALIPANLLSPETPAPEKKSGDAEIATVLSSRGAVMRVYTLADHGEKFEEFADMYAKKHGGSVEVK